MLIVYNVNTHKIKGSDAEVRSFFTWNLYLNTNKTCKKGIKVTKIVKNAKIYKYDFLYGSANLYSHDFFFRLYTFSGHLLHIHFDEGPILLKDEALQLVLYVSYYL